MKAKSNYIPPWQFILMLGSIEKLKPRIMKVEDIQMLFKITYRLGLRITESIRLKAEDFDLKMFEVFLGTTKTNKNDYASIPPDFVGELQYWLVGKKGMLFKTNRSTVYYWLIKLGKMLDIPALTTPETITGEKTKCHIFRKSVGKDMIYGTFGKQAPINIVMKKLRHSDIRTTSQYLKVGIEDVKLWESS